MSILIKGADMPENCGICNALYHGVLCHVIFKSPDERPKNCPLVEVPAPHGRLIDADKLCEYAHNSTVGIDVNDICRFPCVIEAEEQEYDASNKSNL